MSEDKIIAADDALLQERAKLLAELCDITTAADKITTLREENARLREALKPFSAFADAWEKQPLYGMDNTIYALHGGEHCGGVELKLTDLRAAAAAIREGEKDGNNN